MLETINDFLKFSNADTNSFNELIFRSAMSVIGDVEIGSYTGSPFAHLLAKLLFVSFAQWFIVVGR